MEFNNRTEQLAFAIGFATRAKAKQLDIAISEFFSRNGCERLAADVFEFAPHNHSLAQVIRGIRIYEKSKSDNMVAHLQDMLAEYFQLVSDFEPPCSYDGRAFYVITTGNEMAMQCDRCMKLYSLDGVPSDAKFGRFAFKRDFIQRYHDVSAEKWPYHQNLLA